MQASRIKVNSFERDDHPRLTVPRTLISPRYWHLVLVNFHRCVSSAYLWKWLAFVYRVCRDNARMITSLPVSPSSSPLRHDGGAYSSFFLSPPHPSYPYVGQSSSHNYSDHSVFPLRPNSRTSLDPWLEIPQFRSQAPFRSPTRNIL